MQRVFVVGESVELSFLLNGLRDGGIYWRLCWFLRCKHGVDVAAVLRSRSVRFVRRWYAFLTKVLPVDVPEEWMTHDVASILGRAAQPFVRVALKQAAEQRLGFRAEIVFHYDRLLYDVLEHLFPVLLVVGRAATQHLVQKSTQTPPVNRLTVPNPLDDFRRQILWCAAERISLRALLVTSYSLLGEAEVRDFYVACGVK